MTFEIPKERFASKEKKGGNERAASTWSKEALENLKEDQIIKTLQEVQAKPASQWHIDFAKGKTSPHVSALQGALTLLHLRNPSYLDPGKIDGVYANIKNGAPDLANSKTARAMEVITGKRFIDEDSITKLIAAIKMSNAAETVQKQIEDTGVPNPKLRALREGVEATSTGVIYPKTQIDSYGRWTIIEPTPDGKFTLGGLDVAFMTEEEAVKVVNFITFCANQFEAKGENESPWHIQPVSGDLEFNRADQYFDVEIIDKGSKKLPAEILKASNLRKLADYLNSLGIWKAPEAAKKAA